MIVANLPDGRKLTFPDGTDPQVIQATVRNLLSQGAEKDPRLGLQDLLTRQSKGEQGLQEQITSLRQNLNIPDQDKDVSGFRPIQAELPAGAGPIAQSLNQAGRLLGAGDLGTGIESFTRGAKQGLLNVGTGLLGIGSDLLGQEEFNQDVEVARNIERQKTEQITSTAPVAGFVGELAGELAAVPAPAARTLKGAAALGAGLGAVSAEGTGGDPVTGALVGGVLSGALQKVGSVIQQTLAKKGSKLADVKRLLENEEPDVRTLGFKLAEGGDKVIKVPAISKAASVAQRQGFEPTTVSLVVSANNATKKKFNTMLDIASKSLRNKVFANNHRVSDVLGDSFFKRLKVLGRAQKKAGRDIDRAAKSLEGQIIDPTDITQNFIADLRETGATLLGGKLNFSKSNIQGASSAEKALRLVFNRFNSIDRTNPVQLHKLKRFIDNQVEFGKSGDTGLLREADNILKSLRRSVDSSLDNLSPVYRKANDDYSAIVGTLDPFRKLTGKKINDLADVSKSKAIGTLLRRELSNAQSRLPVLEARNTINDLAKRFGGKFDDNLDQQIAIVQDLEKLGLSKAETSLKGQIPLSKFRAAAEIGEKGLELLRGKKSNEAAIKSIRDLIKVSK